MRLTEAASLASLRAEGHQPIIRSKTRTGAQLANDIWSEARSRGINGSLGGCKTTQQWRQKWLPSQQFHLMRIPLNVAALACSPREENLVLKKIYAREEHPIVVDYNRNQVGRAMNGFVPQVIVIDGKHRFKAATLRGDSHIVAWVGEEVAQIIPALEAHGGGGMGGGGGPAPERVTPAPGSSLVAKKKLDAEGGDISKMYADYKAACKGGYKPRMDAVTPPGWKDSVERMKRDHPEIDNPFALAWYMHDKGDHPHSSGSKKGK